MSIVNAVRVDELETGDTVVLHDCGWEFRAVIGNTMPRGSWINVFFGIRMENGDHHIEQKNMRPWQLVELVRRPWPAEQDEVEMLDHVQTSMEAALGIGDELGPIPQDEDTNGKIEGVLEFSRQYLLGAPIYRTQEKETP